LGVEKSITTYPYRAIEKVKSVKKAKEILMDIFSE
jgi:hypothetical protein